MAFSATMNNASSALIANRLRMATVSSNVSNASTEGYSRQRLEASFNQDNISGNIRFGGGVDVQQVTRMVSEHLIRSEVEQAQKLGGTEMRADLAGRLDSMFAESEGTGVRGAMNELFQSVSDLANNPDGGAERNLVIQRGKQFAEVMGQRDQRLRDLQFEVDRRVDETIQEVNTQVEKIADLNKRIVAAEASTDGEALQMRDRRDLLMKQLGENIGVTYHADKDGNYNVQLKGTGHSLVQGGNSYQLERGNNNVSTSPGSGSPGFEVFGGIQLQERTEVDLTNQLQSQEGKLGAQLTMRDDTIVDLRNRMDSMATAVVEEVNKVHAESAGLNYRDGMSTDIAVNDVDKALVDRTNGLPSGHLFQAGTLEFAVHNKSTDEVEMRSVDLQGDESLEDLRGKIDGLTNLTASIEHGRLSIASDSANHDFAINKQPGPFQEQVSSTALDNPGNGNLRDQLSDYASGSSGQLGFRVIGPDGAANTQTINVDPTTDDLSAIASKISNQVGHLDASVDSQNRLQIKAEGGYSYEYKTDTASLTQTAGAGGATHSLAQALGLEKGSSNALAATGVHTFFGFGGGGDQVANQTGPFREIKGAEDLATPDQKLGLNGDFQITDSDGDSGTVTLTEDDTLKNLKNQLSGLNGVDVQVSLNSRNQLVMEGNGDKTFRFTEDTAGVMDRLGIAGGTSAAHLMEVESDVADNPDQLAAGQLSQRLDDDGNPVMDGDGEPVYELTPQNNQGALAWADLQNKAMEVDKNPGTPTDTFIQHYSATVGIVGDEKSTADSLMDHQGKVMDQIQKQREQHSGVNVDEEMMNMMDFQRNYQAASKLISTADEMMASLLQVL